MEEKSVILILQIGIWNSGCHLACFFQQQDVLKQVVASNFYVYIVTAVLQYKYLLCYVMNYIGEPIQAKNNHQKKVIMLKLSLSEKEMLATLYICLR